MIIVCKLSSGGQNIQKFLCSHHTHSSTEKRCLQRSVKNFPCWLLIIPKSQPEDMETVFSTIRASQDSAHLERSEKQQLLVMPYWTSRKCGTMQAVIRRRTARKSRSWRAVGMGKVASIHKVICLVLWKAEIASYLAIVIVTNVKTCLSVLPIMGHKMVWNNFSFNLLFYYITLARA